MIRGVGFAFAIMGLGLIGFSYSGIYDVSARVPHDGMVSWFLSNTSHQSVKHSAKRIVVPDLTNEELIVIGSGDFDAMCVDCHGAPGKGKSAMGQGLNPVAPDLSQSATHMSAAELFWVTENGIKMTGMPAWGATHSEAELWPVVAFLLKLPELSELEYKKLVRRGQQMSHHSQPLTPSDGDPHPPPENRFNEGDEVHGHDAHDHEH